MRKYREFRRGKRVLAIGVITAMLGSFLCGCEEKNAYTANTQLDTSDQVTLVLCSGTKDFPAADSLAAKFSEVYPNCKVKYEYMQDYENTLDKRLASEEDCIDLFLTNNMQNKSERAKYSVDFMEEENSFDLSETFPGLIDNFKYTDQEGKKHLYAIPIGAELRGIYVNKTILNKVGAKVPTTRTEFLQTCEKLKKAGYVPIQDNPGAFAQRLVWPYIAHIVAEMKTKPDQKEKLENSDSSIAEQFRDPMQFIYQLNKEKYYNYKYVELECNRFTDMSDEALARYFLNIKGESEDYKKADDVGEVPFMTGIASLKSTIDKTKNDYHSKIDYEFIMAPITDEGGYSYLSPARGIAINRNTKHLDWCLEFMKFMFAAENNVEFANMDGIMPNTKDLIQRTSKQYHIPQNQIGEPADVTLEQYNLYILLEPVLIATSKANNPKYMKKVDGKKKMYDFDYYMKQLKQAFKKQSDKLR